ncbi:hypothetical protein [Microbacterium sp. MMO-10]|uniref:hypothetical protein n=1 Tax=Microbacterium sp. MMO-10 TaxID=3081272 RepID=UPI0030189FF8
MSTRSQTPKARRRFSGWIVLGIVVAAIVGPPVTITLVNDASARSVESSLRALPLPERTELVDSTSRAAKIVGNGNGMQYLGALLIRSDESAVELQAFYDAQSIPGDLTVAVAPSGRLNDFHGAGGFLDEPGEAGTFVVYAWGEGPGEVFEEFDLRGH